MKNKQRQQKGKHLSVFSIKKKSNMTGQHQDKVPEQHHPDKSVIRRVAQKLEVAASSPERSNLHIIARGEQWIIKREGAQKAYRIHETQTEAIDNAKEMIEKGMAAHIIVHEDDGTVAKRM